MRLNSHMPRRFLLNDSVYFFFSVQPFLNGLVPFEICAWVSRVILHSCFPLRRDSPSDWPILIVKTVLRADPQFVFVQLREFFFVRTLEVHFFLWLNSLLHRLVSYSFTWIASVLFVLRRVHKVDVGLLRSICHVTFLLLLGPNPLSLYPLSC